MITMDYVRKQFTWGKLIISNDLFETLLTWYLVCMLLRILFIY